MIVRAYTPNPAIISAALPLFAFIGIYHLCDALQVTSAFVLRAYKVAVVPTIIYALMLWGVGLGGGYVLGFALLPFHWLPHGAAGFWLGNTASVFLAAICLGFYLRSVEHKVGYKSF
jgi:MATE family multidrug resistance protein